MHISFVGTRAASALAVLLAAATTVLAQTIEIQNLDGIPFQDRLAFSRIGSVSSPPPNGVHDRGVLRVHNTGSAPLSIDGLRFAGSNPGSFAIEDAPSLPVLIEPASHLDLTLRFVAGSEQRVHDAALAITSNDPMRTIVEVELGGYWQQFSERRTEPTLQQIIDVFGYTTAITADGEDVATRGRIVATGDEVISAYWRRADAMMPVTVRQIAAWHTYPESHALYWHYRGSADAIQILRHEAEDSQSVLPRRSGSPLPARGSFTPSSTVADGVVGFRVGAKEWSDPALNDSSSDDCSDGPDTCGQHLRFWVLKDRDGTIVPNTFILSMDYAGINYDYQDNVYLISNVTPATPVAGLQPVRINAGGPELTTGGVSYLANLYSHGGAAWTPRCDLGNIAGTMDDELYRTEWSEATSFSYRIPALRGSYVVRLHFAEIAHGNCSGSEGGAGKRVFDVSLEGWEVLSDFDISSEAGAVTALVKAFRVDMTDGILNVDFAATVDFPMVSAIEVLADSTSPPPANTVSWSTVASAPLKRTEGFGGFAADGRLYVFGGYYGDGSTPTNRGDAYDPVTDSWSPVANLPGAVSHAGVAIDGHDVYIAGGYPIKAGGSGQDFSTDAVYRYNTKTDTYTVLSNLPAPRGGGALVVLGETLHFFGGSDSAREDAGSHWVLSLDNGTGWNARADLPIPRNHLGAAALNGKIYAVGGQSGQDADAVYRANVHAYDPNVDAWIEVASLPAPVSHINSSTFKVNGRILVAGGDAAYNQSSNAVYIYSPSSDAWAELNPLPAGRVAGVADDSAGSIFFTTGSLRTTTYRGKFLEEGANAAPVASFTASPQQGPAPLTVSFDAGGSTDHDGTITGYEWDFGDDLHDGPAENGVTASHTYESSGTYVVTLVVTDDGGATNAAEVAIVVADGAGPFLESGGLVVFEAEHHHDAIGRSDKHWLVRAHPASVGSAVRPEPVNGETIDVGFETTSPELRFSVEFESTGPYYVWVRAQAPGGDADSWHVGLDGREVETARQMSIGHSFDEWRWISQTMNGLPAMLRVDAPGERFISVWMREDGVYLDRILLTTDPEYVPDGLGPAESARRKVDLSDESESVRGRHELVGNYPNPFQSETVIQYSLSDPVHVSLEIFDVLGRRVALLVDHVQPAGRHEVRFDASSMASGMYLYRLTAGSIQQTSSMVRMP